MLEGIIAPKGPISKGLLALNTEAAKCAVQCGGTFRPLIHCRRHRAAKARDCGHGLLKFRTFSIDHAPREGGAVLCKVRYLG
jgi:hypothetical protein